MLRPAVLLYNTTYYDTYLYVRTATPAGFHNGNDSKQKQQEEGRSPVLTGTINTVRYSTRILRGGM